MTTSRRNTIMLWMAYTEFFYPGCELQPGCFYPSMPELFYYTLEDGACIGAAGIDAYAQLLDFNKYTKKKNRQTHPSLSIFLFIFTCVVVAFCPVNPINFLLHFYAIGVWIRSENRRVSFCPVFYKSQCFQASAAFITEAEILMKPARIRRYLTS